MITILNPVTLKPLCNIVESTSIIWNRRFYEPGAFEIHIASDNEYQQYLQDDNIISVNGNSGIISYVHQNKNDIEIRGSCLKGLCYKRQVIPPFIYENPPQTISSYDRISGKAETVMKHYIDKHLVNPTDTDRKIQKLIIAPDTQTGSQMSWQAKFNLVSDELKKIGIFAQLGYDIKIVNGQYVFDVIQGVDRTKKDGYMGSIMFSKDFKTIDDYEYKKDSYDTINIVYTGGSGEEETQYVTEIYDFNYQGIYRREGFTTISSDSTEYVQEVADGGKAYLKENSTKETISATANDRLVYKTDWDLGDYASLKIFALGENRLIDKQITEVKEEYENGNMTVTPTFEVVK